MTDHYRVGDVIPDRGTVTDVWLTAYRVRQPADAHGVRKLVVVPFYGVNGAHATEPHEGFTFFADGSRYRGTAIGLCPCECNSGGFCGGCGHAGCGGRR